MKPGTKALAPMLRNLSKVISDIRSMTLGDANSPPLIDQLLTAAASLITTAADQLSDDGE